MNLWFLVGGILGFAMARECPGGIERKILIQGPSQIYVSVTYPDDKTFLAINYPELKAWLKEDFNMITDERVT